MVRNIIKAEARERNRCCMTNRRNLETR